MEKFKFIDDISDLRFVAYGKTLNELFENCACAMFEGMMKGVKVKKKYRHEGNLVAENLTYLLHDFLSELLFIFETEHLVFKKFKVEVKEDKTMDKRNNLYNLNFIALGDKSENYVVDVGIKGITYHRLSVERKKAKGKKDGENKKGEKDEFFWDANVLCDI